MILADALAYAVDRLKPDVLLFPGDAGDAVYIIIDGAVRIDKDGQEILSLQSAESFGETSLLDGAPRYATAMGLVMEGAVQRRRGLQARDTRSVKQFFGRMKAWFERNF